jgi:glutamyl-tRNA synthetase
VGTAYVALFNYAFAKQHGGQFILRIEDTDRTRSTKASENTILEALRWVGLEWDEGPDVGGPHGPYRQSERGDLYAEHAGLLIASGNAFRCFMTPDELTELRKANQASGARQAMKSPYTDLPIEESDALVAAGTPFVVRLRVPGEGICVVDDLLRGTIEIAWDQVDQQILLKSDGMPTYHLANVVDDHHMEITHVLRGEEWISSAPKHLLLYKAFGWTPPVLCHLPLLRNPDKSKLSKRKNPTSILYYQRMGFMPEALLNYLGRMAWSMPDEREKFSLPEMLENFDLERVSLGGPVFDVTKLEWLNGLWIRELDDDQFADQVADWALNRENLKRLIPVIRQRVNTWADLAPIASFFLHGLMDLSQEDLRGFKGIEDDDAVRRIFAYTAWALDAEPSWDAACIQRVLREMSATMDYKLRVFLAPFFVALSGRRSATPLFQTMEILGRDIVRARIRHGLEVLKPLSGKEQKRWEKSYTQARAAYAAAQALPEA